MARHFAFRAMSAADLPLVRRWLETPEVARWWGQPDEQYALVSGDLDHPDMDQFIVSIDGRPFAYIQCYALSAWNQGFGPQPLGTRGIDQFIGEPDMIGRGHGSHFILPICRPTAALRPAARRDRPRSFEWPRRARL